MSCDLLSAAERFGSGSPWRRSALQSRDPDGRSAIRFQRAEFDPDPSGLVAVIVTSLGKSHQLGLKFPCVDQRFQGGMSNVVLSS